MAALALSAQVQLRDSFWNAVYEAGELGFEPRLGDPESPVLPLHHSPTKDMRSKGGKNHGDYSGSLAYRQEFFF